MMPIVEFTVTFLVAFGLNLIPFLGPSNLLIASTAALSLENPDPVTLVALGLFIALAAALAKGVYYVVTFFLSNHLSEKNQQRLDREALKVRPYAFFLLFLAAATPIPDEPVVIPLGLMKYSPAKFFSAYFIGKLAITVSGAFLGEWTQAHFSGLLSTEGMVAFSIVLTVAVTVIMFKVDVGKLMNKIMKKTRFAKKESS
jgi:membrane protein DedA with SNARE-associated domain